MFQDVTILTIMVRVRVIVRVRVFHRDLVCSRGFLNFLFSCKWF